MIKLLKGNTIYLSLGSNLGDRMMNLNLAKESIRKQAGKVIKVSRVYQSEAWGYSSQNPFYNCSLALYTQLEALDLLDTLMGIEKSMGRIRKEDGYADRLIDIDLLLYGEISMTHPRLTLPHPAMDKRRFVLEPLLEIAPDLLHPITGLSIREMLERCPDTGTLIPVESFKSL